MGRAQRLKLLITTLFVAFLSVTAASAFTDTRGHPSEAAINKWSSEYGLISGYGDGTFRPNDSITKGAFAGIMDRLMHFRNKSAPSVFRDTAGTYWEDAMLKAHAYAIMLGDNGYANPSSSITRQQAVSMIARAFDFSADAISQHYVDDVEIAGYARSAVSEMAERGYLNGVAENYFRPNDPITRADAVRIFDNIMTLMIVSDAPISRNVTGNVLISSQTGATLSNMSMSGDLYIAPGVVGSVVLENVAIGGTTHNFAPNTARIETRSTAAPPPIVYPDPTTSPPTPVNPAPVTPSNPTPAPDSGATPIDSGETTAPVNPTPVTPSNPAPTSGDSGETTAPVNPAPTTPNNGWNLYDPGETTSTGIPPAPTPVTPTPDNGQSDSGETTPAPANPDSGQSAAPNGYGTMYDPGETTTPGNPPVRPTPVTPTPDNGQSDSGETTPTPVNPDNGQSDTGRSYDTMYDPGETTGPVRPSTPTPANPTPVNPTPSTPDNGATTNPENQLPIDTPSTPVNPIFVPDNPAPANPNYGTLPTNKPVSQWTVRDVYSPGATTGQYFTYQGSRIPIYRGVKTRNVYSGDFVWRTGRRLRYVGNRYDAKFGVDVSAYQNRDRSNETINWTAARNDGVQFAMIRIGLRGTSTGALREDAYYARNIDGAMAAGIQTGVYIFAQATTIAEAIEEADFVIARLRGHQINGPVSYDWEMQDSSYRVYGTSKEMATACAVAFCKRVAAAGYTPMVYNSRYVAYIKYDQGALAPYMMWYPQYPATSETYPYPNLYYQMDYWQFTDSAVVEGIGRKIDANIWFKPKS